MNAEEIKKYIDIIDNPLPTSYKKIILENKSSRLLENIKEIEKIHTKTIFESIGKGDEYFIEWEKEIHPILCEVALSADQIQSLFTTIEKDAGRNLLGKTSDAVSATKNKISDVWFNKLGGMLQKSKPVENFDVLWEEIKNKIKAKHPDIAKRLEKYGVFAENHPIIHKFLLAIGGSVAAALGVAVAGGVSASALSIGTGVGIAVGILNIADRLLQGQKFSTSIGRGVTSGFIAGLTAGSIRAATQAVDQLGEIKKIKNTFYVEFNKMGAYVKKEDYIRWKEGMAVLENAFKTTSDMFFNNSQKYSMITDAKWKKQAELAYDILFKAAQPEYQLEAAKAAEIVIKPGQIEKSVATLRDAAKVINPVISAILGQVAGGKNTQKTMSESQINELFGITGNKFDAARIRKAWEKAGKPTDSTDIKRLLLSLKVPNNLIDASFKKMDIKIGIASTNQTQNVEATPTDSKENISTQGARNKEHFDDIRSKIGIHFKS